ncbi:SBBP repeat-containing protein [Flavobacterium sp.]|uniref:SBBP repeat-containing protein n=1 Tax=Flavobacterium sp. TaxID=239 RepID=UPI0039E5D047
MIKKIYCTTVLLCSIALASAQSTQWSGKFGGDGEDVVLAMHTDANGNTYTTGYFSLSCDFDIDATSEVFLHTNSDFECFVQKTGPDGNFLWARGMGGVLGDYGTKITTDAEGNVYVTGVFQDVADFDPSDGIVTLTSAGSLDIFVVKLNEYGDFVWARSFEGTEYEESNGIGVDSDGNVYVSGYFYAPLDFDPGEGEHILTAVSGDGFLVKLNANGSFIWAKQFGGSDFDLATGMKTLPNGDVYISGNFTDTADFDPSPTETYNLTADAGTGGIYLMQLKANGDFVKAVKIGQVVNGGYGLSVDLDSTGAAYVTGYLTGVGTFVTDGGTVTMTPSEYLNGYVAKITNEGTVAWAKQLTSDMLSTGYAVAVNNNDEVFVSGYFNGNLSLGDTTLTEVSELDSENFVTKMDTNGNFIWARQFGGINTVDRFTMSVDNDSNVYLSGAFEGTVDIDPDVTGVNTVTPSAFRDNFLIKMNGTNLSVTDHGTKNAIALYPNPVKNVLSISGAKSFRRSAVPRL